MAEASTPTFLGFASPTNWGDIATLIGSAASAGAAVIAVVAALYARKQIHQARSVQREAGAHQAYLGYLQMAFENPKFSSGYKGSSSLEFEQYEWYVSYMLDVCEQILQHSEDREDWRETVKMQISYHRDYISNNKNFRENYVNHYTGSIRELIESEASAVI